MIPILYDKTETSFTTNGLGRLIDCVSCEVTEERNGIYECEFVYPISGKLYKQLMTGGIIGVIHDDNHDVQPFDIYKSTAPIDGMVTFNAHHISYRLSNIVLSPYTASDIASAMSGISSHSVNTNPFSFSTTKSTVANFALTRPKSVRATLMGEEGSFLDVFGGGEYKFDKWSVTLSQHRGTDTGVTVRYGKNLTDIEATVDSSGLFSAVAPYYQSEEVTVYLPEYYVTPTTPVSPVVIRTMDMTDYFEETPTEAQLRTAAIAYLDANTPWIPSENIKIDFTPMWQSPEYESVAEIQRVGLCDTVSIYYTDMDIVAEKAKVVRVVYDVLREKFSEIEVGDINREYVVTQDGQTAEKPNLGLFQTSVPISATVPTDVYQYLTVTIAGAKGKSAIGVYGDGFGTVVARDGFWSYQFVSQRNADWHAAIGYQWDASTGVLTYVVMEKGASRGWGNCTPTYIFF